MTTAEGVSSPVAAAGAVRFLGDEGAYWRLRIKGAALVVVTLGIYRFWLATDVRRFLWSNTEISGDTLEYNGLATELLVGFLFAVAILVPLYMVFTLVALELDLVAVTPALIGFALLLLLGEYALYRARRYRLTRTVFRGLRFDQHGSPWRYALYALLCWGIVIVTLGLAYPWTSAFIERFKMRNTSYGDLQGRFEGRGLALFWRGLPIWLLVVGVPIVAIVVMARLIDWNMLGNALAASQGDGDSMNTLIKNNPQLGDGDRHRRHHLLRQHPGRRAALSGVPGGETALVDFRAALRRGRRHLAAAHQAGVPGLFASPSLSFSARIAGIGHGRDDRRRRPRHCRPGA